MGKDEQINEGHHIPNNLLHFTHHPIGLFHSMLPENSSKSYEYNDDEFYDDVNISDVRNENKSNNFFCFTRKDLLDYASKYTSCSGCISGVKSLLATRRLGDIPLLSEFLQEEFLCLNGNKITMIQDTEVIKKLKLNHHSNSQVNDEKKESKSNKDGRSEDEDDDEKILTSIKTIITTNKDRLNSSNKKLSQKEKKKKLIASKRAVDMGRKGKMDNTTTTTNNNNNSENNTFN